MGGQPPEFLPYPKWVDPRDAERCCGRLEENLRLVERGRLVMPVGADLRLFLLTVGKLDRNVEITNALYLIEEGLFPPNVFAV